MRKLLLLLLLSTLLLAKNPIIYASLGDTIYNNAPKINKLKNIDAFKIYAIRIDDYIKKVKKCKQEGFVLDKRDDAKLRQSYLNKLRSFAKTNDYFLHLVRKNYEQAIEENNYELFSALINSGLLDTKEHKKEILNYYFAHAPYINSTGVIQKMLDEDERLRERREAQRRRYKSKKEREAQRIRQIRQNDKLEHERLEKKLQQEVQKKKLEIREYQKRELSKTI